MQFYEDFFFYQIINFYKPIQQFVLVKFIFLIITSNKLKFNKY